MSKNDSTTTSAKQILLQKNDICQNFILVWLNLHINQENDDFYNLITKLNHIVSTTYIFIDLDECIDFITDVNDAKVFIIVSTDFDQDAIRYICDLSQLEKIYIYSREKSYHDSWIKDWPKVKGIFNDLDPIYQLFKLDAQQCDQNSISISFIPTNDDQLKKNFDELDQSFMYTQLLKEILLEFEYNETSLKELTDYCRQLYFDNDFQRQIINELEREYQQKTATWWYTRECFLYKILNYALRSQAIGIIIKMGFFLRDLHQQLEQLYIKQIKNSQQQLYTVYRGQGLSHMNFDKLRKSQGGLMSFNNFLSTSVYRDIPFAIADSNRGNPDFVGILFKITIDSSISYVPFANIKDFSCIQSEDEVLFSMHTVFRIGEIERIQSDDKMWQVNLLMTADNAVLLKNLTECIRLETQGSTGWDRLGKFLITINQFDKAEELYNILSLTTSDDLIKYTIQNQLGLVKNGQGKYKDALLLYDKAIQIGQDILPPNHIGFTTTYNNIALTYTRIGEHSKALLFYEKSLQIQEKVLPSHHSDFANTYNNMGLVYFSLGNNSKALPYFQKALDIYLHTYPSNHPTISLSYNNIASVYYNMGNHREALSSFDKSLKIRLKTLPLDDPDLAISYSSIGTVYEKLGDYSKALSFHKKSLEIYEKVLQPNHPFLATSYNNIAAVFDTIGDYSKALLFYEKSLAISQNSLPSNHPDLVFVYNNIGVLYENMREHSKALLFYEKSLEIRRNIHNSSNSDLSDLATPYNNIGASYAKLGDFSKALMFIEKSLEIRQNTLPSNHPDLACSYNNMAYMYTNIKEYSKALLYYEKSLEIKEKCLPTNHIEFADVYNNIASLYYNMGQYSKAISFHERALDIGRHSLPLDHPKLQIFKKNLESLRNYCKRFEHK